MTRIPDGRVADRLRAAMATWQHEVLALTSIDAVTTEPARLRAARHHDCHTRLSIRSAVVEQDPLGAEIVERALEAEPDDLAEPHRLAVVLADALMVRSGPTCRPARRLISGRRSSCRRAW